MIFTHDDLIEIIRLSEQDGQSSRSIADIYGCSKSSINYFLAKNTYAEFWEAHDEKPVAGGSLTDPKSKRVAIGAITDKKVFILTSAQNNTYIHDKFWNSLLVCAEHKNAEIIVGTFTYNKMGFQNQTSESDDVWFDPKIRPYIRDESIQLAKGLVWSGELNILPTAVNPISGLNNYTAKESCIIPHTKVNLESVPSSKHEDTKIIYTTGTLTQSNYIQKKSGQKAEFNHIFGAVLVEVDKDGTWFARQLIAESESGCFYDLKERFCPKGVVGDHRVLGINWGDIHIEKLDGAVGAVSFGVTMDSEADYPRPVMRSNMLDQLMPSYSIYNDIIDFKVRNHHNRKDPLFKVRMQNHETDEVDFGLEQCAEFLSLCHRDWCQQVVVNSNHDAALRKWAVECSWFDDPVNAEFLLTCQLNLVQAVKRGDSNFCIFEHSIKSMESADTPDLDPVKFLRLDESFVIGGENGIECGYHGHTGNNGARGSTQAYRIAGSRYNIGHQHSAGIKDGVYVAGVTAKMDMGYNVGMSSWSQSHIVTYQNTKRTIITIKDGRYKAEHRYVDGKWIK